MVTLEWKLQNVIKLVGASCLFILPPYALYWKYYSMKNLEKGIFQDFQRIKSKGKTLDDIPRKE